MKPPWGLLLNLGILITMWLLSIAAVVDGQSGLFNRVSWVVLATVCLFHTVRVLVRDDVRRSTAQSPADP